MVKKNNQKRNYTQREKAKLIEYRDILFKELGVKSKVEQNSIVKNFDKMDGDDSGGTLVEVISDAIDQANISFSYKKLEDFYQKHIKEK